MARTRKQEFKDFVTFPFRAAFLFHKDRWGLSALASERFHYVQRHVHGYCLDVGCGRGNRFVREFLQSRGRGIDLFRYEGLTDEEVVEDLLNFPFPDATFATVTFVANVNHIPEHQRDVEFRQAFRVLRPGGNIVVTMGNPIAEVLVHLLVRLYDRLLATNLDMDAERGMADTEAYYLRDREIVERLERAGFVNVVKEYFVTQWGLNHLFVGWKPAK